jgi:hypothetical protein
MEFSFSFMNVAIFWDLAPCSPYVNRRFGGTYHLHLQGRKSLRQETSDQQVAGLIFDCEHGGDTFLRNIGSHMNNTALYPRRFF